MGISIRQRNPQSYSGMGNRWGGPSGVSGLQEDVERQWGGGVPMGYNPAIVAAGAPVNTGDEFAPTVGVDPFNSNPYNIDNIAQPTDWYGNPTSGWESFAPTGGFNPFNTNPFNIDNIVQPAPAYPTMNAPYTIAAPWVNPNIGFGYQDPFGWYREQNRSR